MYRIISNNQVVAICDRFRWVRMMDGVLVGTIKATAHGFEARVPVAEGESYTFTKQVYALQEGGLTGTEPVGQIVEFHGAVDLQDRDAVLGILVGENISKGEAESLRAHIETAAQSLPDDEALDAVPLHPVWAVGRDYPAGHKVQHNSRLWRCIQAHTAQEGWEPDAAAALWEGIDETHAGTLDNPIPYEGNMALTTGLYYEQYGVVYLCTRDTVNPVYNDLVDLVGLYVEVVEA